MKNRANTPFPMYWWRFVIFHFLLVPPLITGGCGRQPEVGRILSFKGSQDVTIRYGLIAPPLGVSERDPSASILAVPTGHQMRRDAVSDMENLWHQEAMNRNWLVVIPITGPRLPFFWRDPGMFGDGPEAEIPQVLAHVSENRGVYNTGFHVVEIGGDGFSGLSIARSASGMIDSIVILPYMGIDWAILANEATKEGPPIILAFSEYQNIDFEKRAQTKGIDSKRLRFRRIEVLPLNSGETEVVTRNVKAVCDLISAEVLQDP